MNFASKFAFVASNEEDEDVEVLEDADLDAPLASHVSPAPRAALPDIAESSQELSRSGGGGIGGFFASLLRRPAASAASAASAPPAPPAPPAGARRNSFGSEASDDNSSGGSDREDSREDEIDRRDKKKKEKERAKAVRAEEEKAAANKPRPSAPLPRRVPSPPQQQQQQPQPQAQQPAQQQSRAGPRRVIKQKIDTNVVAIQFGTLALDAPDLFAGDPVVCQNDKCKCVLSQLSKLASPPPAADAAVPAEDAKQREVDEHAKIWVCEFCGFENHIRIMPEEIPTQESRDYVLEPAPEVDDRKGHDAQDESTVVFCIDISGSMCVTKEVPGNVALKSRIKPKAKDEFYLPPEAGFMNVPVRQQRAPTTWVSRLECVQSAVDHQIQTWAKAGSRRKVGLVTFNGDVNVVGDGSGEIEVIAGQKLNDEAKLQEIGNQRAIALTVTESAKALSDKIYALEETGPTALGPALIVSVAMAAASKKIGSRVVICTDGKANVGLGSLDVGGKGVPPAEALEARDKVQQWYEGIGNLAKLTGIIIDVISIRGDECALEDLGRLAEATGGSVTRVDPVELVNNFGSILQKPTLATNVTATMVIHSSMSFRNEPVEGATKVVREVGSVNEDTEVFFEYGLPNREAMLRLKNLNSLPFQVQIHFTRLNGMKCLRVISKTQEISHDREAVVDSSRMGMLAANVAQKAARMAEVGDYDGARSLNVAAARYMSRNSRNAEQQHVAHKFVDFSNNFHESVQQQSAQASASPFLFAPAASPAPAADAALEPQGDLLALPALPAGSASPALPQAAPSASESSSRASKARSSAMRSDEDYMRQHRSKFASSKQFD